MNNALTWSPDNRKIEIAIMERGYDKNTTMNVNFIKEKYTELDLSALEITDIDAEITTFKNLKILHLSENKIPIISNLPANLEQLIIAHSAVERIDPKVSSNSLQYLNLSSNSINENVLGQVAKSFPNLLSLDVSFNYLTNIVQTSASLISLRQLKVLYLTGNPITIIRNYIDSVKNELPNLKRLDGVVVSKEETEVKVGGVNNIAALKDILFAEDREKARLEAEEKNKKPGQPAKKDDKKAPPADKKAVSQVDSKKDLKKPAPLIDPKTGKPTVVEENLTDKKQSSSQRSIDVDPGKPNLWDMPSDIKTPFKVKLAISTAEKLPAIHFDDLSEEQSSKKENTMSSYWLEYNLSKS